MRDSDTVLMALGGKVEGLVEVEKIIEVPVKKLP